MSYGKSSARATAPKGELVKSLCAEYEVDGETAAADVREFLSRLSELGFVSEVAADAPCEGAV